MLVFDSESDDLWNNATKLHCFVGKQYKKNQWYIVCNKKELPDSFIKEQDSKYDIEWINADNLGGILENQKAIICHNIFGHDLPLFEKLKFIRSYDYGEINGKSVKLIDTLSMSRCLNPDRQLPLNCPSKIYNKVTGKYDNVGPHSLAAWGYRVANKKPQVDDWRNQPLEVYVHRCIEDVIINELTLEALIMESKDVAIGGDWRIPLEINNKADFLMNQQERHGIKLDEEAAWKLLDRIDGMMEGIEIEVNAQLPERPIPKSRIPTFPSKPFTNSGDISSSGWAWLKRLGYDINEEAFNLDKIPAKPFKGDGKLSSSGIKFCEKMGWEGSESKLKLKINSLRKEQEQIKPLSEEQLVKAKKDLINKTMPSLTEPMTISNQDDVKKYLVESEGWEPTIWRTKDVSRDQNKRAYDKETQIEKIKQYIEDIKESPYKSFVYQEMGINFEKTSERKLVKELLKKARYLVTSPKLKDERGELCPNLEKLNGELGRQIVKWLSLRNRRAVLKALDDKKQTGWLNDPRLKIDGRIGQGFSGVTNTNRYKHVKVVNLPKASPDVLLGHEMRSLLTTDPDKLNLGYDGSNLEQFVAASYAYKYDNGEYADKLKGDAHTTNAIAYSKAADREVSRSEGKNISYGILYGAQKTKISKMMGISPKAAQAVIDAFWDTNFGLKKLKENLEKYWERTGKQYIKGIDGRKIYTRSRHSLVNALFQSCGSLIMFLSGNYMYDMLKEEGLIEKGTNRLAFVHDEYQYEIPRKDIKTKVFPTKEKADGFIDPGGKLWSNVKEIDGKFYRFYSRVGELGNKSLAMAGEYFKMPLPFNATYDIGRNFAETH